VDDAHTAFRKIAPNALDPGNVVEGHANHALLGGAIHLRNGE